MPLEQPSSSFVDPAAPSVKSSKSLPSSSLPLLQDESTSDPSTWRKKPYSPEWRKALYLAIGLAALVLALNIIWVIVAVTKYPLEGGLRRLYQGKCTTASRIDSVLHVVINILSTALLAASNYVMQCLNAPTRDDIDNAHKKNEFVSIGITTMQNLFWIPKRRAFLFVMLFITAWPLHLV